MIGKAKTIKLLLENGDLQGLISMAEDNWNGEIFFAPRDNCKLLLKDDIYQKWGIYLLLSSNCVYIGQSKNLKSRIEQHLLGKDWWENVVILTTKDDDFNKSDIDYLETTLISIAQKLDTLDVDNIKKGNPAKVDKYREASLKQFLDESFFLLEFIGINVFSEKRRSKRNINNVTLDKGRLSTEVRAKKEAITYLKSINIHVGKNVSYAKLQENKGIFWINPKTYLLRQDWFIILNNQPKKELSLMFIPANTFDYSDNKQVAGKLQVRKDKPDRLDLNIDCNNYVDTVSNTNFRSYILDIIKY